MIIILSQNKEVITKCKNIQIVENNVVEMLQVIYGKKRLMTVLGTYATEERAKEVLQEIFNHIKWGIAICDKSNKPYFEMPQE